MAPINSSDITVLFTWGITNTIQKCTNTPPWSLVLRWVRTEGKKTEPQLELFTAHDDDDDDELPEVWNDSLLVESGHRGRLVHTAHLRDTSNYQHTPLPQRQTTRECQVCADTHHVLYFGRYGDKLVGLCLAVLWDELHIGNPKHPSKIGSTVAFPADWRDSQLWGSVYQLYNIYKDEQV